jgi:hypothetical protein
MRGAAQAIIKAPEVRVEGANAERDFPRYAFPLFNPIPKQCEEVRSLSA